MSSTIHVGLEIGTSQITVAVGEVFRDGAIRVMGVGTQPSRGVRKGEIVDPRLAVHCIADAVSRAEDVADVEIGAVFLSLTGPHIGSVNNSAMLEFPKENSQVDALDIKDVKDMASAFSLPEDRLRLHTLVRDYEVDGQGGVVDPKNMYARELRVNVHLVHAIKSRMMNPIMCVREIPLTVEDVVFAGYAASQVVSSKEERMAGCLVVDFGAGTTDFVLYHKGAPLVSGCVPLGGDHLSNDIAAVMQLKMARAEQLKLRHGHCRPNRHGAPQRVELPEEGVEAGCELERKTLDQVIEARVGEIFSLILKRVGGADMLQQCANQVIITGGSSLLPGLAESVEEMYGMKVRKPKTSSLTKTVNVIDNPRYSTAIGLVRSARMIDEERLKKGAMARIKGLFADIFGMNNATS